MYIDTHAHLYLEQFNDDIEQVLQRSLDEKIDKIFLPNIDSSTIDSMKTLVKKNSKLLFPMMGLHPCSVKDNFENELRIVSDELAQNEYYGVGEAGIDLYWDKTYKTQQIKAFEYQIELALNYDLPIIIHSRDALDLTIEIIESHQNGRLKGIFHCFNGDTSQAKKIINANFLMGLGGVITFKKAQLDEVVNYISFENMVLETDAPYLSPTPYRGKRNESSYIPIIAAKISQIKETDIQEVMKLTTRNAENLFRV